MRGLDLRQLRSGRLAQAHAPHHAREVSRKRTRPDMAVAAVVDDLQSRSKKIKTSEEIAQVGTISANGDPEIGEMLAQAMQKVGSEGAIQDEEAKSLATELEVVEGMQF